MNLSLEPLYFPRDVRVWLVVFGSRLPLKEIKTGKASDKFTFSANRIDTFHCWWYVMRTFADDKHTDFKDSVRASLEEETVQRAGTCSFGKDGTYDMMDIEGTKVGTLTVQGTPADSEKYDISKVLPDAYGGRWLAEVTKETPTETNITELAPFIFGSVKMPDCTMPTWKYVDRFIPMNSSSMENVFKLACWFMRVKPEQYPSLPLDTQLEINAEMQSMATRFCCYAKDATKTAMGDHLIDDWTYLEDNPAPEMLEFDCEDGAVHAVNQGGNLQNWVGPAAELERRYLIAFAIVTLSLGGGAFTYHAVCMKFPKFSVFKKMGMPGDFPPEKGLPVILVETTAWTTSNWRFTSPYCTEDTFDVVSKQTNSVNAKVPAPTRTGESLYRHVCTLIFPELPKIGQVQMVYKGKFGVPIDVIMRGGDEEYEMKPVYITEEPLNLPLPSTRGFEVKGVAASLPVPQTRIPKAEFVVRSHDWKKNKDNILKLAQKMGTTVESSDVLEVYGGIGGVRITVY